MDIANLLDKFTQIGARMKVADRRPRRFDSQASISLDIRMDRRGEYFEVARRPDETPEVAVLDVQPDDRHLLLLVREGVEKRKFLCGHDERHWFVAAIPESRRLGRFVRQRRR